MASQLWSRLLGQAPSLGASARRGTSGAPLSQPLPTAAAEPAATAEIPGGGLGRGEWLEALCIAHGGYLEQGTVGLPPMT